MVNLLKHVSINAMYLQKKRTTPYTKYKNILCITLDVKLITNYTLGRVLFHTNNLNNICVDMAVTENYPSTPHTDRDLSKSVISWFLESEFSLSLLFVLNTISFLKGEKNDYIPSYSHFFIVNLVRVGQRNNIRRAIFVLQRTKCFFTQTGDCHTLLICVASTLHHAHPRGRTAIGLCIVLSEVDVVPICNSTDKFVSH
jgi:hypothetical protein